MTHRPKTIELSSMPSIVGYLKGVTGGRVETISQALECMETPDYLWMKEGLDLTIVRETARRGTLDDIRLLHSLGYDLQAKCLPGGGGGNALHVAAQHNRQAHAMLLLEMGLEADKRYWIRGFSAMDMALANGNLRLFSKLLKTSGDIDDEGRRGFLKAALENGDVVVTPRSKNRDKLKLPVVRKILQDFGPYSQQDLDEALEQAAQGALVNTFESLSQAGANLSSEVPIHFHHSFNGITSATVLLFIKTRPETWDTLIHRYAENTPALFPSLTKGREENLDLDRAAGLLEDKSPTYRDHHLHNIIAPAMSFRAGREMEQAIPQSVEQEGEDSTFRSRPPNPMRL